MRVRTSPAAHGHVRRAVQLDGMGTSALMGTLYGMGTSALPQLQRRRDSACEDDGAAQAREEARGLA